MDAQTSDAPHLFESNAGGGAASNGGKGPRVRNGHEKPVPQGDVESHGTNETAKIRSRFGCAPQSRCLIGSQEKGLVMAKTAVADIIIPTEFEKYAIERTAELSAFGRSAASSNTLPSSMNWRVVAGEEVKMPF